MLCSKPASRPPGGTCTSITTFRPYFTASGSTTLSRWSSLDVTQRSYSTMSRLSFTPNQLRMIWYRRSVAPHELSVLKSSSVMSRAGDITPLRRGAFAPHRNDSGICSAAYTDKAATVTAPTIVLNLASLLVIALWAIQIQTSCGFSNILWRNSRLKNDGHLRSL